MDYFKQTQYLLETIRIDYLGGHYQGHGVMTWEPDNGFHLEAFLTRQGDVLVRPVEIGKIGILCKSDFRSIRMKVKHSSWAIAPGVPLYDRLDLLMNDHLSIDLSRVIFFSRCNPSNQHTQWFGTALYRTSKQLMLPDTVLSHLSISNQDTGWQVSRAGIYYEDEEKQKIIGRIVEKGYLELNWALSSSVWSKTHCWHWPEAAQDALSILFGQTVRLLRREVCRGSQKCTEVRKDCNVEFLDFLSPFGFGNQHNLDKDIFVRLTEFLARNEPHAEVCRNIFKQIAEASRQQTTQARELLLSTILEAALRSIYQHPYKDGDKTNVVEKYLKQFRDKYLPSKEWKPIKEEVLKAHKRLRHRNAHPDWLISRGGTLSDKEKEKALDDMIFLSCFYGYMIMAIAGFKDLEPRFPTPHKEGG
jgi:hypothetical protein